MMRATLRAALLALCATAAAAGQVHLAVKTRAYQSREPLNTLSVRVVDDGAACDSSANEIAMCASRDFVCRMEVGKEMFAIAPSCLLYEPEQMRDSPFEDEADAAAPWGFCDPQAVPDVNGPPTCQRQFQCECGRDNVCHCVPPDLVPDDERVVDASAGPLQCGGGPDCADGEYCKYTTSGGQACGRKPYYS